MHPGASDGEFAKHAGVTQPAAHFVMRRLQAAGWVSRTRAGKRVQNVVTASGRRALQQRSTSSRTRVARALSDNPGISRRALAAKVGLSSTTVQYHVTRINAYANRSTPS